MSLVFMSNATTMCQRKYCFYSHIAFCHSVSFKCVVSFSFYWSFQLPERENDYDNWNGWNILDALHSVNTFKCVYFKTDDRRMLAGVDSHILSNIFLPFVFVLFCSADGMWYTKCMPKLFQLNCEINILMHLSSVDFIILANAHFFLFLFFYCLERINFMFFWTFFLFSYFATVIVGLFDSRWIFWPFLRIFFRISAL